MRYGVAQLTTLFIIVSNLKGNKMQQKIKLTTDYNFNGEFEQIHLEAGSVFSVFFEPDVGKCIYLKNGDGVCLTELNYETLGA